MSLNTTPYQSSLETVIGKLYAFCSVHSPLKSEEQLAATFENFLSVEYSNLGTAEEKELHQNLGVVEEAISVLHELEASLLAESDSQGAKEIPQAASGNRLYASLKRHPE
ncbi:hypothetical protein [Daejeonella sp.]|uniref:hypothetical protein n=1 Tax=Daejeonella sp. TaxID=2805397 RepID=UPI0030BD6BD7